MQLTVIKAEANAKVNVNWVPSSVLLPLCRAEPQMTDSSLPGQSYFSIESEFAPAFSSWHQPIFQIMSSHAFYSVTTFLSLTSQDEHFFFLTGKNQIMSPHFKEKNLQWQPDSKHHLYAKINYWKSTLASSVVSLNTKLNLKQK